MVFRWSLPVALAFLYFLNAGMLAFDYSVAAQTSFRKRSLPRHGSQVAEVETASTFFLGSLLDYPLQNER